MAHLNGAYKSLDYWHAFKNQKKRNSLVKAAIKFVIARACKLVVDGGYKGTPWKITFSHKTEDITGVAFVLAIFR